MNKKKPCRVCETLTSNVFNISFEATPICEDCARAIFMQQASFYASLDFNPDNYPDPDE